MPDRSPSPAREERSKHDKNCLRRKARSPYLCTCGMTDTEVDAAIRRPAPPSPSRSCTVWEVERVMEAIAAEFGACSNHTAEKVLDAIDRGPAPSPSRSYTVHVCSLCGSGDIAEATEDNALCGQCGEWMNTVPLVVVPREVLEEAEREKKRRGELNRTLFDKLKAAVARAEEAERERGLLRQRRREEAEHFEQVRKDRDEARAALTAAQEKIARAPHAKHCEAGAPMWPGPCTCWKRGALSDTDQDGS